MNTSFLRITALISSILLTAIGVTFITSILHTDIQYFLNSCPNTDVLSWDANLRLIGVLDQLNSFQNWRIVDGILPFIDSPTWPPLRPAIMMIIHTIDSDYADTISDVFISTAFFIIMVITILPISISISGSVIRGTITWFFVVIALLHGKEIHAYFLSSMLETQGMFFSVLVTYFLYCFYAELNEQRKRGEEPVSFKGITAIGLLLSSLGLYMTKYPYGLMLIMAIGFYEVISRFSGYREFVVYAWKTHYKGLRRLIVFVVALFIILLVFSRTLNRYVLIPTHSRGFSNLIYLSLLILFVDFVFLIFKQKSGENILPAGFKVLFVNAILPSMIWQFLHPDRLMSAIGSQQHMQDAGRLFVTSFFGQVFSPVDPSVFIAVSAFIGIAVYVYFEWKGLHDDSTSDKIHILRILDEKPKKVRSSIVRAMTDPLMAVTIIVAGQFFILEFLTGNKQLRHIYHLLPALGILSMMWLMRTSILFRLSEKNSSIRGIADFTTQVVPVLFSFYLITLPDGLYSQDYQNRYGLCFTGSEKEVFDPARYYADTLENDKKYLLINLFHDTNSKARGRQIATDFDLLFRKAVNGNLRNDSKYRIKSWKEFDELLILGETCITDFGGSDLSDRINSMSVQLEKTSEDSYTNGGFCLVKYKIIPGNS